METHQYTVEPLTPGPPGNESLCRTEDSGYYTSFTPGSVDCSSILHDSIEPQFKEAQNNENQHATQFNILRTRKLKRKGTPVKYCNYEESPTIRRGTKRSFQDDSDINVSTASAPTPTSVLSGGLQKLKVNDSFDLGSKESFGHEYIESVSTHLYAKYTSYPTTPVKKVCRNKYENSPERHNSSPLRPINNLCIPPRRSGKKLNFVNHNLAGETIALIPNKPKPNSKVVRTIFRPEQKIDIIMMLYQKVYCMPALNNIFGYLSTEDIYNFSKVSTTWSQVCEDINKAKTKKQQYEEFIINSKENQGMRKGSKNNEIFSKSEMQLKSSGASLKDIYNVVNSRIIRKSPERSPPTTPRTRKFRTYTKSASLDSRMQLSCVRCRQPAKVTEEASGEEWAECTSSSCSYQFCRFCKCERHPSKLCFRYDLDGPSPSKRKKKVIAAGTKSSKRNLKRLLN